MRGVATSDWHLGHRRYAATEDGRNVREADVEAALRRALANAAAADPDLVVVPGDIFDSARPSYTAAISYRDAIHQLRELTEAEIVLLQGNHCAVRTAGSTTPDRIVEDYNRVHVVTSPRRLHFTTRDGERVAVACFPFTALDEDATYSLEPDPEADVNVLALHGAVKGDDGADALPWFYVSGRPLDVGREAERWDVCACGDFHDYRRLHPEQLAFYSGAIERTSSNIWDEDPTKGVVVFDTAAGELEFVPHEVRPVHSWTAPFSGDDRFPRLGDGVDGLNAILSDMAEDADLQDAIVRLVVEDFPREQRDRIDWSLVRALKATCLHFQLDLRWAESGGPSFRDRRDGPSRTVEDDAREFFDDDDEDVRRCVFDYLAIEEGGEPHTESAFLPARDTPAESPQGAPSDELQAAGGTT